jgi:hypothetical protein
MPKPNAKAPTDLPHASAATLDKLEPLLAALRAMKGMRETSRGRFYRRGRTFLHFHEHEGDLFADVRWTGTGWAFERVRITAAAERKALLARITASMTEGVSAKAKPAQRRKA